MAKKQGDITALYERLSRDDEQFGDSVSITNQKTMLETYARENGYVNIQHYTDDGYSGGSFERPGWKKMIEDIDDGKISTVIAKDMSRIGRNYLEVGYFTEIYFGQKNIHFIAVSNNVDSNNQGSSEFAPFLNIMNEWYLKDCSNKIKASKRSLGNSGVHLAAIAPFGYKKDPNDKHKWLVDEEAAEVVRLIYKLCIEGYGTQSIAGILKERHIETPAYYAAKNGIGRYRYNISALDPYNWNSCSVKDILTRMEYLGYTVNFKTSSKSYKEHKNIVNNPDKWAVFENTQEPIIDAYSYQLAQKLIGTSRRIDTFGEANPLTGLVFCADCGAKMYNHRSRDYVTRFGQKKHGFDGYDCSAYKLSKRRNGETVCKCHNISTKALREVILCTIQNVCKLAIEDRNAFIAKVRNETEKRDINEAKDNKRKYNNDIKRMRELDILYQRLYESFASGIVSEDKFKMLAKNYETEQNSLKEDIAAYESNLGKEKQTENNIEDFCKLVDKYTVFDELTTPMLNEFIDKVLVYKGEKVDGERVQRVDVYLNFIGKIDFPATEKEISPEQEKINKYWKERYKRTKESEDNRRKKKIAEKNSRLEIARKEDHDKLVSAFDAEVQAVGLENIPVVPARLKNRSSPKI